MEEEEASPQAEIKESMTNAKLLLIYVILNASVMARYFNILQSIRYYQYWMLPTSSKNDWIEVCKTKLLNG